MIIADAFLDELAERVAAKVVARLAGAASTSHYGTGRAATLPPGKSRSWALRTLKKIPGARKVGRDWVVSVEDFDAWTTERDTARVAPPPRANPANDMANVEALAAQALVESGFRRVRDSAA